MKFESFSILEFVETKVKCGKTEAIIFQFLGNLEPLTGAVESNPF